METYKKETVFILYYILCNVDQILGRILVSKFTSFLMSPVWEVYSSVSNIALDSFTESCSKLPPTKVKKDVLLKTWTSLDIFLISEYCITCIVDWLITFWRTGRLKLMLCSYFKYLFWGYYIFFHKKGKTEVSVIKSPAGYWGAYFELNIRKSFILMWFFKCNAHFWCSD